MATAEPTRADDTGPGPGAGPRTKVPAPQSGDHDRDRATAAADAPAGGPAADPVVDVEQGPAPDRENGDRTDPPREASRTRSALDRLHARLNRHLVLSMTVLSGVLHLVWFFTFANSGGDLAAQDAWAEFVGGTPTPRTTSPGTAACTRCRTAWCRRI